MMVFSDGSGKRSKDFAIKNPERVGNFYQRSHIMTYVGTEKFQKVASDKTVTDTVNDKNELVSSLVATNYKHLTQNAEFKIAKIAGGSEFLRLLQEVVSHMIMVLETARNFGCPNIDFKKEEDEASFAKESKFLKSFYQAQSFFTMSISVLKGNQFGRAAGANSRSNIPSIKVSVSSW